MRAGPGDVLFRIADHRVVWVLVDVAERDLGADRRRPEGRRSGRARYPGRTFTGKVALIYPHLNAQTRTARIRIELPNPDELLRPDMYVDVEIDTGGADAGAGRAGQRRHRQRQPPGRAGRQGRRPLRAARRSSSAGAATATSRSATASTEGEAVVTSANFLIDAESNLKAALQGLSTRQPEATAMIARLIAWSARNLMLVLIGTGFAAAAGIYALLHLPLDAIPDLSDTQVIVYTEYPGQAPQVVEDQVTYPLTTAMLTVPKSKVVRGFSFFGVSFVYVIFEDGTDIYWARSRVLEYLNARGARGCRPA